MKYIIMCGTTDYVGAWPDYPKHVSVINGEVLVERTIRLLHECGVYDIYITSNDTRYANFGVKFIEYHSSVIWVNGLFNFREPACYLFGDVYYSYTAINTIVSRETTSIDFFGSSRHRTIKRWNEPFGFKVVDYQKFFNCVDKTRELCEDGTLKRCSAWELWEVIQEAPLNRVTYKDIVSIDDYTCDVDEPKDIITFNNRLSNQNVMIHCIPERLWYVKEYLVPSLESQFISKINVWVDTDKLGNLKACLKSFESLPDNNESTWHLQDDVLVSSNFASIINSNIDGDIICGFSSIYDKFDGGIGTPDNMWYSFPCIRIPNKMAREFVKWCNPATIEDRRTKMQIKCNKYDDTLFNKYLKQLHPNARVNCLIPNIVNHVDWLIGGSVTNPVRNNAANKLVSRFWDEDNLVEELEKQLKK